MSEQIKKWCDAIMFHEDDLDIGTCKTLKMITDEARRLTAEIERLQKRNGNIDQEYVPQRSQLEDANFALHCAYEEIDNLKLELERYKIHTKAHFAALGHHQACDCAVCDDIAFRQSVHKTLNPADPNLLWLAQQQLKKYKEALESIRDFEKNSVVITTWPDAFSRLVNIAKEALGNQS